MFDPSLTVNDVKNIVTTVINKNKTKIAKDMKNGKTSNPTFTIKGVKYKVSINSQGHVSSAYPVK